MANALGNAGIVKIGSDVVAEVTAFSISESIGVADTTVLGDVAKTHKVTIKEWNSSITAFYIQLETLILMVQHLSQHSSVVMTSRVS